MMAACGWQLVAGLKSRTCPAFKKPVFMILRSGMY